MSSAPDRLFTPRFLHDVRLQFHGLPVGFQLFPTAPYRVLALGGGQFRRRAVLGFLTYASRVLGAVTGAIADRLGRRRTLLAASLVLAAFAVLYGVVEHVGLMLAIVLVHGVFCRGCSPRRPRT